MRGIEIDKGRNEFETGSARRGTFLRTNIVEISANFVLDCRFLGVVDLWAGLVVVMEVTSLGVNTIFDLLVRVFKLAYFYPLNVCTMIVYHRRFDSICGKQLLNTRTPS